jgi:membrane protease subunit HflK
VSELGLPEPPSVRIIGGIARRLRRRPWRLLLGLGVLALLVWLGTGIYSVNPGESATLRRFGHLVEEGIGPGLHVRLPDGVDQEEVFKTSEVLRVAVEGDAAPKLDLITGDENIIGIDVVVQYEVTDLADFLYRCETPSEVLKQAVRASMLETVSEMIVDEVLTSGKVQIQNRVREKTQVLLRRYHTGITLLAVTIQAVDPPREAAGAFRKVSDARAEAAELVNDAHGTRQKTLSLARAGAVRQIEAAQADSASRALKARGEADRFLALLEQHRRAPEQTRVDLYRQVMGEVIPRAQTIVLAPGEPPRIDVHLRRGESPEAAPPASASGTAKKPKGPGK